MTDVLRKRVNLETDRHTGKMSCADRSYAATSPGTSRNQKKELEQRLPAKPSDGTNPLDPLLSDLQPPEL